MSDKTVLINAKLGPLGPGTGLQRLAWSGGRITEIGPDVAISGARVIDCEGRLVLPAFIDCHTHLVYGGHRCAEFEQRLEGVGYQQIAAEGGGILSTMRATRGLDVAGLVAAAQPRLAALMAEGVSTVEIKSGYGLEIETELNMLRAARKLGARGDVRITTTWLAAHAMPPDFDGSKADYIREVAMAGLAQAHAEGVVDAVDAFCEGIAFAPHEIAPLFEQARQLGLPVKLHAEQLSHSGGVALAARYGGLSADHIEYATAADVAAMHAAGMVAVILPGAFYMLRETQAPPIATLRAAGVPMAVATDCNPGSSPLASLRLAMNMAAVLFGMTVQECLAGVTQHAAQALGLAAETGQLRPGLSADLTVWDVTSPAELVGQIGHNPLHLRVFKGQIING